MNTKFRQQPIKQQLFTADVDIKSWLKALYKQNKSWQNRQKCFFYALPLATQQYVKGAAFPAARLLGPNNINNTYSNLE